MDVVYFTFTYGKSPLLQIPASGDPDVEALLPTSLRDDLYAWSKEFDEWVDETGFFARGETRRRLDKQFDDLGDRVEALGIPLERNPWWRGEDWPNPQ